MTGLPRPEQASSLATDDLVFAPLGCSAVASAMMRQAGQALDRALIGLESSDGSDMDVAAVLHELRSALVHSSHAIAVLAPARAVRVRNALRIAWTAFTGPDDRSGSIASLTPFTNEMVAAEVAGLLRERSFAASPRWHEISSVRVASDHLRSLVADGDLHEAVVRFLWDDAAHSQAVLDDAVTCAEVVATTLTRAARLWDVRGHRFQELSGPTTAADGTKATSLFSRPEPLVVDPYRAPVRAGRRRRAM